MKQSSKAALGGIVSALSVVIMLCTYISPFLVYTAPPFAGLLLILIVKESGYKWALGTYFCVSLLSVFLIADKESAVFYTMFYGYYPALALFLNLKIKSKLLRNCLKLIIYNTATILSLLICAYVFGIDYNEFTAGGIIFVVAIILMLNILLIVFDILIDRVCIIYDYKIRRKFRKLFNIR